MSGNDSVIGAELRSRVKDLRQTAEKEYSCSMGFDPGFRGFEGHFEGNPIVPGVCLIETARVVAETVLGRSLATRRVPQCRFRRPIFAEDRAEVKLKLEAVEPGTWKLNADIRVGGVICAQLRSNAEEL